MEGERDMAEYHDSPEEPAEVSDLDCRDWKAIHSLEPPGPGALIVSGVCTAPSTGHRIELERQVPQGINPNDLLLRLVRHEPSGPSGQALTEIEVRYVEETDLRFDSVTILPDGPSIGVERAL